MMQVLIKKCRRYLFQVLATATGCLAAVISGINLGWTSPYLPQILNGTYPEITMTSAQGSWCAVMPLMGAVVGALIGPFLVDKFGRKFAALCFAPIAFAMFIILAYAKSIFLICFTRFCIGIADGSLYTSLLMYLAEIADPDIRGILTASMGFAAILGTLLINLLGFYFSIFTSSLICSLIPLAHFVTFMWMPESPYFLIKTNRKADALKSLEILRGTSNVEEEMKTLSEAVSRQEKTEKAQIWDLFSIKSNRRAVLIFVVLNLTKKFSGKNPFIFYTATIFQAADTDIDPKFSVIFYICIQLLAAVAALYLLDRAGRRPVVIFATIGCVIALTFSGLYFFLKSGGHLENANLGWLPLTSLAVYIIFYNLGLEFTPTVMAGELFPLNVKGIALGLTAVFSEINGIVVSKLFQILTDNYGMYLPFWFFAGCCLVGLFFICFYVPETKNKSLEEIQMDLIKTTTSKEKGVNI